MASKLSSGIRRTAAHESINTIAAALCERYDVPNTIESIDLTYVHLEVNPAEASALYQAQTAETINGLVRLFASVIDKLTPLG